MNADVGEGDGGLLRIHHKHIHKYRAAEHRWLERRIMTRDSPDRFNTHNRRVSNFHRGVGLCLACLPNPNLNSGSEKQRSARLGYVVFEKVEIDKTPDTRYNDVFAQFDSHKGDGHPPINISPHC